MVKKWILAGIVSFTLAGAAPTFQPSAAYAADRREFREVRWDDLPGNVKDTVGREIGQDRITSVTEITRGKTTVYEVATKGRNGRNEVLRVSGKGQLLSDDDTTAEGSRKVRFEGLPGEVKQTLGRVAGNNNFRDIWQVTREGDTYYVADVETRDGIDRIRVDDDGRLGGGPRLLSNRSDRDDRRVDDRRVKEDLPNRVRDDFDRNDNGRLDRYEADFLGWNELPGRVKDAVGREMGKSDRVVEAYRTRRDNRVVYRIDVDSGNASRVYRVSEDGEILKTTNDTEEGRVRVRYNELPGRIKSSVSNAVGNNDRISRVDQVTHNKNTWYVVTDDRGQIYRFDDEGNQIRGRAR